MIKHHTQDSSIVQPNPHGCCIVCLVNLYQLATQADEYVCMNCEEAGKHMHLFHVKLLSLARYIYLCLNGDKYELLCDHLYMQSGDCSNILADILCFFSKGSLHLTERHRYECQFSF